MTSILVHELPREPSIFIWQQGTMMMNPSFPQFSEDSPGWDGLDFWIPLVMTNRKRWRMAEIVSYSCKMVVVHS